MKTKVLFAALLLSATTAFAQQEKLGSGIDKANMDLTIKPGNDFYRYAAGNWMKNNPLDAEHTDNGAFTDLFEQNQKRIQDIILEYASKPQQKGSLEQKIGSLYNLRMDSVRLNKEGWAPIKPTLDRIAAIKDRREYQLVTAQLDFRGEGTMMFGIGVDADLRDAANNIVQVGQGGIGLGVRDYYVNDDDQTKKIREAYKAYMKQRDYFIRLVIALGVAVLTDGIVTAVQPNVMGYALSTMISCFVWFMLNMQYFKYMMPGAKELLYVVLLLGTYMGTLLIGNVFIRAGIYIVLYVILTRLLMRGEWDYGVAQLKSIRKKLKGV